VLAFFCKPYYSLAMLHCTIFLKNDKADNRKCHL
jgi:hypothetical protein